MSWLIFGAVVVPTVGEQLDWQIVAYALLSLTVIRMLAVAAALWRAGLDVASVAFVGWFGPRGLASLIFALLALEDLGGAVDEIVAVIGLTVLFSVICHGFSAVPLARRYGRSHPTEQPADRSPTEPPEEPAVRRLTGRR